MSSPARSHIIEPPLSAHELHQRHLQLVARVAQLEQRILTLEQAPHRQAWWTRLWQWAQRKWT